MAKVEGKKTFYPKVCEALISNGYKVFSAIQGKGRSPASEPDYIAINEMAVVIGEIKSPSEGPRSDRWRTPRHSDPNHLL